MGEAIAPALVVLAAGMGSRYGGLKQVDPVGPGGETIIDYSIFDALRAGFGKVVFVIRREMEQAFRETVGLRFEKRIAVEYVFQELDVLPPGFVVPEGRTKPWGTGHAILMASRGICSRARETTRWLGLCCVIRFQSLGQLRAGFAAYPGMVTLKA
jgi:NDP-sugar pyrophosphorylase family protein